MRHVRDLTSLILAMTLLQLAAGVMGVLLPLSLDNAGASETAIGLTATAYAVGFLAGGIYAPSMMARMGAIRAYAAFAAAAAAITLALYWRIDAWSWAVLRALLGFCFVGLFTVAESWMSVATPAHSRGSVLGVYHVVTKVALLGGPFLILGVAPLSAGPFMLTAGIVAIAMIPLCWTRQIEPAPPTPEPFPLTRLWRLAPGAVIACFAAGVLNAGLIALLPIYAAELPGEAVTTAAVLQAAAWIGGIVIQWPAGRISDIIDRRLVIAALAAISALGVGALAAFGTAAPFWLAFAALGAWGAGSLSFYGVAVAHATDHIEAKNISKAIAGLLIVYGIGAIVGPSLYGGAMQAFGARGLFVLAAAGGALLAVTMLLRTRIIPAVDREDKEEFAFAPGSGSPAISEAHPAAETAEQA